MSKFNLYARKVDDVVRRYAKDFKAAKAAVIDAEAQLQKANANKLNTAEAKYKSAVAGAELQKARDNFRKVKFDLTKMNDEVAEIRQQLKAAVDSEYAAKPSEIDMPTMELLRSGILTERDYIDLLANSPNKTMTRLIAEKMEEWAKQLQDKTKATEIRQLVINARADDGQKFLSIFDGLADAVRRTANNDAMFDRWDDIAKQTVESF